MIVNLAARDVRDPFIEQGDQHANQLGFGLPAQAQQNEVVARQDGIHYLRRNAVVVAHDAGEQRFAPLQFAD
jgi:hypothetical protein